MMKFDPENPVIQRCASGMDMETIGNKAEAKRLYTEAWTMAASNMEKYIAAHYLARQQDTIPAKLEWDQKALEFGLLIDAGEGNEHLPSLYLNMPNAMKTSGIIKRHCSTIKQHTPLLYNFRMRVIVK